MVDDESIGQRLVSEPHEVLHPPLSTVFKSHIDSYLRSCYDSHDFVYAVHLDPRPDFDFRFWTFVARVWDIGILNVCHCSDWAWNLSVACWEMCPFGDLVALRNDIIASVRVQASQDRGLIRQKCAFAFESLERYCYGRKYRPF